MVQDIDEPSPLCRQHKGGNQKIMTTTRVFYIILGVYILLYCVVLNRYIAPSYYYVEYFWFIPTIIFSVAFILAMFVSPVARVLDKVANIKAWTILALTIMVACGMLQIFGVKSVWGSSLSIGLTFASVVLVMHFAKGRLTPGKALLLGCGCAWAAEGILEGIYKSGFLFYHDYPGGTSTYYTDLAKVVFLWIIPGVVITVILGGQLAHGNIPFVVCATLIAVLTMVWFLTGFKTIHFYSSDDYLIQLLSRSWRVVCCFAPALLFIRRA